MIALALLLSGCAPETLYRVDLEGEVLAEPTGPITLTFAYHWWGDGELSTPFQPIHSLEMDGPGVFSASLDYFPDDGEGLLVYGWQDLDGDNELCAPGAEEEPSGLVEVSDFPTFSVEVLLPLDAACRGPETLLP